MLIPDSKQSEVDLFYYWDLSVSSRILKVFFLNISIMEGGFVGMQGIKSFTFHLD